MLVKKQKLKGQRIGIVLREEEYIPQQGPNAGKVRTRLIVDEVRSIKLLPLQVSTNLAITYDFPERQGNCIRIPRLPLLIAFIVS